MTKHPLLSQHPWCKFRILQVTTSAITINAFLLPFARHYRSLGVFVAAMASGTKIFNISSHYDQIFEARWSRNPLDIRGLFFSIRHIANTVHEGNFNIVHVHTPVAAFLTRLARGEPSIAVIYTAHGFHFHSNGSFFKNTLFSWLEKLAGRWTDYLVVINQEDWAAARQRCLVPDNRIIYMPGIGVDTQSLRRSLFADNAEINTVRAAYGIPEETPYLLMVAEFNPGKRHRDLLQALTLMQNQEIHLLLVGTGKLLAPMQQLVKQLGLESRVHFGFRTDIAQLMCGATLCVLPSEREGLPRSIMEAMCLECPVAGADTRGIQDLLTEDRGYLFPVGNPQELARTLDRALNNPQEMARRAGLAHEYIGNFSLETVIELHDSLYQRALAEVLDETTI